MQPGNLREPSLKAGAARVDITPEPGISLTGFIARLLEKCPGRAALNGNNC